MVLVFTTCNDKEDVEAMTSEILVNFKATYDSEPLQMLKIYDYNGVPIQFTKFDFYVGDMVLTQTENGSLVESELSEIDFVDLSFSTLPSAETGVTLTTRAVEADQYEGIKLGIGVPADLNDRSWEEFAGDHPLRNDTHYWEAWNSFIFVKIEGKLDFDGDGNFENGISFHTGTDELFTGLTFNANYELKAAESRTLALSIDVQQLFQVSDPAYDANSDGYVDLETHRGTHTDQQLVLAEKIMNNFNRAVSLVD